MKDKWRALWIPGLAFLILLAAYLWFLRPHISGIWGDDAVYLLAGKALATDKGYTYLPEPGLHALVKYPPLYPLVLAPIWWLVPEAPANLPWFKLLNLLFSLGALALLYRLARRVYQLDQPTAAILCLFVGLNYSWLSTMLDTMSEPLFILLLLKTLYLAASTEEHSLQPEKIQEPMAVPTLIGLIVLSCLAFYTRTMGLALIIGMTLWLWQKNTRQALIYLAGCALACLPWVFWCQAQPSTLTTIDHIYLYPYNQTYKTEVMMQLITQHGPGNIMMDAIRTYPESIMTTLCPIYFLLFPPIKGMPWVAWGIIGILWVLLLGWGWIYGRAHRKSILFCCLASFLIISAFWYSHDQYVRLLLSILPLMALVVFQMLDQLPEHLKSVKTASITGLILLSLISPFLLCLPHGDEIVINAPGLWDEYQDTFRFIRENTPSAGVVWAFHSDLFALYTDRKTINRKVVPSPEAYIGLSSPAEFNFNVHQAIYKAMQQAQVRYLVIEPHFSTNTIIDQVPDASMMDLVNFEPGRFQQIYVSPRHRIQIYQLNF